MDTHDRGEARTSGTALIKPGTAAVIPLPAAARSDCPDMLTFFEVGLFGWMAVMAFVLFPAPHHLMPDSVAFWFLKSTRVVEKARPDRPGGGRGWGAAPVRSVAWM
jgi:hypothetical protein